jgi:hypothetical protein
MYKALDSNIISDIEYHDKTAPGSMAKELLDIWALGKSPIKILAEISTQRSRTGVK